MATVMAVCLVASTTARLAAQVPAGWPFMVGSQGLMKVVADAAGNFTVVWTNGDDGDQAGIFARRYDDAGTPLGPAFVVNSSTAGYQGNAFASLVALNAAGDLVVVWNSFPIPVPPDAPMRIVGQRLSAAGQRLGGEFTIHSAVLVSPPSVASDAAGNFMVVWSEDSASGDRSTIWARRYAADGAARGAEFRVDGSTTGVSYTPSASCADGMCAVLWATLQADGGAIRGRRYGADGLPLGAEFVVSDVPGMGRGGPIVNVRGDGSFAAVWNEWSPGPAGRATVRARLYDPSGSAIGADFEVTTAPSDSSLLQSAALDPAGGLLVTWATEEGLPWDAHLVGQRLNRDGTRRGQEFLIATGDAVDATVDGSGNMIAVWTHDGPIYGQRYGGISAAPALVDARPTSGSDGNGVLEPGETVEVTSSWHNVNGEALTFGGRAASLTGPPAPGVSYELLDDAGDYGTVPSGSTARCTDCYDVGIPFGGTRPATHWDATLEERLTPDTLGQTRRWPLHVGQSFADVPKTSGYYRSVETLLHKGVTVGCLTDRYCPDTPVTRQQMAVFSLMAKQGPLYAPSACGTPLFGDVPASSVYCRFVEELARRGVVAGCGGGDFCPDQAVTREQMPVFVLRTLDPALDPPACAAAPFSDVPASSPSCRWIQELVRRGVVNGCGGGRYCAGDAVTREQMAVFVSETFGLHLYGP